MAVAVSFLSHFEEKVEHDAEQGQSQESGQHKKEDDPLGVVDFGNAYLGFLASASVLMAVDHEFDRASIAVFSFSTVHAVLDSAG